MVLRIVIGFLALIIGILISRIIQGIQVKRLDQSIRNNLVTYTRKIRKYAILPEIIVVILFIVGVRIYTESFIQLVKILFAGTVLYGILLNIMYIVANIRAHTSVLFLLLALFSRLIGLFGVLVFGYLTLTAFL